MGEFMDFVWSEIYDDGPVMGDRNQYREIVTKLYIEGVPAHRITWKDAKGKLHRLSSPPKSASPDEVRKSGAYEQMLAMRQQALEAHNAMLAKGQAGSGPAEEVASPPDE